MIIIGAGLAGLLAANRISNAEVIEQQNELPNNHSALLRFRSSSVGDALGIPFKRVNVYKGVLLDDGKSITNSPTLSEYNAYSLKSTGHILERSIINIEPAHRYIAPDGFTSALASRVTIQYRHDGKDYLQNSSEPVISTIPMPALAILLKYPNPIAFRTRPIWTINCELENVDIYQTLYIPYFNDEPYRISITGNKMTLEFAVEPLDEPIEYIQHYATILFDTEEYPFTNLVVKRQEYGKIVPIDENERQKFILWSTDNFNIYSLGRFATWRNILLDDVLKDIDIIKKFINQRTGYQRAKHYTTGE